MGLIRDEDIYSLFANDGTAKLHVGDIDTIPRVEASPIVEGELEPYPPTTGWRCNMCGRMHYLEEGKTPETAYMNCCSSCGAVFNMEAYLSMRKVVEDKYRRLNNA
jgi:hypothetical protein